MPVHPIPEGYHTVTPYLIVDDAERALEDVAPEEMQRRMASMT